MRAKILRCEQGFTLVEVVVASVIGFVAIALVMQSFLSVSSTSAAVTSYRDMHSEARHALDIITRDIVAASEVSNYTESSLLDITVVLADGTQGVRYYLLNEDLHRVLGDVDTVLATKVAAIRFGLYTESSGSTTDPARAHFVDVKIEMAEQSRRNTGTDVLQVRQRMRNKGL
ncbi:MAG: prepilin-type N-terminal cleavage/methylation domain-containing protein [Kiritimatiellia bacterium]|jgi:hypothetical protein|nr:prepilin-type N-terminal cleavage/methylation domain-containing protein [Kiritimatiellia bacterium]MDP6848037.1 prepilin-type N-terminal cleavage/methylation domain-containing protein [Kiritimatiellia bacterium]